MVIVIFSNVYIYADSRTDRWKSSFVSDYPSSDEVWIISYHATLNAGRTGVIRIFFQNEKDLTHILKNTFDPPSHVYKAD